MNPYYEDKWVKIFYGDCREILPKLDVKVDLVLTDPFYVPPNMFKWRTFDEFYWGFNKQWLEEIKKIVKDDYHMFISFSSEDMATFERLLRDLDFIIKSRIVWHYRNAGGRCKGKDRFGKTYEFIFHVSSGKALNFPEKWDDRRFDVQVFAIPQSNFKEGKRHEFQKPEKLIRQLIEFSCNENDLIIDPFLGGGTTCYCAKKLNRYSIGIEIEEKYCEIAAKRCMQESFELDLPTQSTEKQVELSI